MGWEIRLFDSERTLVREMDQPPNPWLGNGISLEKAWQLGGVVRLVAAELGEVGASEAKLREGVSALQVCHLTIAALGHLSNVA